MEIFVDALFRHAGATGLRRSPQFLRRRDKPFRLSTVKLSGGIRFLIDVAEDDARRAAQFPTPVVFCPPLAIFSNKDHAREQDLARRVGAHRRMRRAPRRSADDPRQACSAPQPSSCAAAAATVNGSDEPADKLHLHWRLARPAQGGDLAKLKQARDLAAASSAAIPSNKPVCHPIRWPGSWHRKAEPRLCEIEALDPDREIELDAALAALTAAAPIAAAKPPLRRIRRGTRRRLGQS